MPHPRLSSRRHLCPYSQYRRSGSGEEARGAGEGRKSARDGGAGGRGAGGRNRDGVGAQLSKAGAARGTTEAKATTVT